MIGACLPSQSCKKIPVARAKEFENEKPHDGRGPRSGGHRRVLVVFAMGESCPGRRDYRRFDSPDELKTAAPMTVHETMRVRYLRWS
jgi:hypothetical protein